MSRLPIPSVWQQHPLLPVALCLMTGIAIGAHLPFGFHLDRLIVVLLGLAGLLIYVGYPRRSSFGATVFAWLAALFFMLIGLTAYETDKERQQVVLPQGKQTFRAVIVSQPKETDKTFRFTALLSAQEGEATGLHGRRIQASVMKQAGVSTPQTGQGVWLTTVLTPPKNAGNPAEYDYAGWLKRQGVVATAFCVPQQWGILDSLSTERLTRRLSWWQAMQLRILTFRHTLIERYQDVLTDHEVLAIAAGLTLGDRSLISPELRRLYSETGAGHVLALSGLHLGILYSILFFVLSLNKRSRRLECTAALTAVIMLWAFAALVGFPISVVRSVIMFTLMSVAYVLSSGHFSINNLSLAAIAIVTVSPQSLFDISFQLSFSAVFAILWLAPRIKSFWTPKHKYARLLWEMLVVTVCAQAGVAPLVAYHFHNFPTYFLLTNFLVIPCAYLIIILALLFFLSPHIVLTQWVGSALHLVIAVMNKGLAFINSLPYSSFSLYPSVRSTIVAYLFMLTFVWTRRMAWRHKGIWLSACLLLLVCSIHQDRQATIPTSQIIVYHLYNGSAVHFISSQTEHSLWTKSAKQAQQGVPHSVAAFLHKHRMTEPKPLQADSNGCIAFNGKRIGILGEAALIGNATRQRVDYLLITSGMRAPTNRILERYKPKVIVLDGSLSDYWRNKYGYEFTASGFAVYDLARSGALIIR